ncbi:MAG TPA: FtsX-like permease family protein [Gammaproteobacteria bacterium]|nr:FtsX-like permease family protein [Gammaproteobacteria bacterium]
MIKAPWRLAGRLLARDWRSGEVLVLLAALVVAVGAMSAVTFFTDRVRGAVSQQAGEALAADLRVESINPLPEAIETAAQRHGLATARVVNFRSVVAARETTSLADVRGVSAGYPLRGAVQVADRLAGEPRIATGIPARGEVWAEPSLMARLGAAVGDELDVGSLRVRITQTLEFRPDEGWRLMEIAPTALLNLDDVLASGLLAPGSIAEYEGLFAGEPGALEAFRADLTPLLRPQDEVEDYRDGRPEVSAAVRNAERFLVLAALVSVLLGGVAVAMAARRFVARRLDAVALMKCLGARHREVLQLNLLQLLILVLAAGVIGCVVGFVAQFGLTALLADFIEAQLPAPSLAGAVLGPVTALAVAVGCALPPLLQLGGVPPARVLRNDVAPPALRYTTIYGIAAAAVTGLLYVLFGDFELIAYLVAGAAGTFFVLYLAGRVLVLALQRVRGGVGIAWRYGIANVARRGRESSVQVVAFGIGLMVLLLLTSVRTELMSEWQATLPESAPNHFLINIQPTERDRVGAALVAGGVAAPQFTPLVRARMSHINGMPVADYPALTPRGRGELEDETNLTWAAELPAANEIVSGAWWSGSPDMPELSLEEELRAAIGLKLGDEITYAIGGASFTARLTSTRLVQWDSFRPNFFMVLSPGAIEQFAHTYITSFHVAPDRRGVTVDLVRQFPSVSVFDIGAVLEQVRRSMDRASLAVQYVFLFTLAAGIMVLLAAIQATRDERMFESAVLRTLGARRSVVLQGVAAEFLALGLLAGTLAAVGAASIGYVLATQLFRLDFVPGVALWLGGLVAGALVVGVSGTLAVRSVINHSPVATLRSA